ncbi:MAG TPA: Spo0E family sporulation regulatory protein-aspartic acid phosphatase [Thermoclostridium caenicola]|uniref:Spo0E like sporulation regulatory protein n=1 Tax=Thermoclostridium caenicola TaxID=659425 RepID=A0A1M6D8W5_9FIRM|nr:Spo0E family sporulation regulatory protein-aspartic acid phosphatase [Thermoclostridium caenicola]SHI69665.1 Spo0E like sporulation regulatory protein [Thermoclostridium caenicola]HOK42731.1 Spo0E family sporulation regulatory protein-aspartic acid phosphatase [Thermoclostridium caenicola]HOL84989.1 Spo0E family sporulation regulatory protein-aspartic acid phosphatase [Thermoclostridium caenicola]HOP72744.1 Spo0E family sporulation regulatory protein-aspartic acid phosphatase [Thermoclostri
MKKIEAVRGLLNKAIEAGCEKDVILTISRHLDDLILETMKLQYEQYMTKEQVRV